VNKNRGSITHVSFDHDLSDEHYIPNDPLNAIDYNAESCALDKHKTGYHAAKYLKDLYESEQLDLPVILVHSMNPIGTENILKLFIRKLHFYDRIRTAH